MYRLYHNLASHTLLLVFGVISLCGQGLHFLPGANHFADEGASDHCCACTCSFDPKSCDESTPVGTSTPAEHDCVICKFFAQGQSTAPATVGLEDAGTVELLALVSPAAIVLPLSDLHSGRGPPA